MAYTNFCCRSGGSALNAGTRTGDTTVPGTSADFTYASGDWDSTTRTFTVPGGSNPLTDGVAAGDFASIYANGSTITGCVGRVTSVTSTTIVFDATARMGSYPSSGTATRTVKVGGAWPTHSTTSQMPFSMTGISNCTNSAGNPVRINVKNDATAQVNSVSTNNMAAGVIEGFSSSYGDGSRANYTQPSGATQNMLAVGSASNQVFIKNLTFSGLNATSGTTIMVTTNGGRSNTFIGCVFRSARAIGVQVTSGGVLFVSCEFYDHNRSNTANSPAINISSNATVMFDKCVIHDNAGSNTDGIRVASVQAHVIVLDSVFDTNGRDGIQTLGTGLLDVRKCEFYNNAGDGIDWSGGGGGQGVIMGSKFVLNGGWGINLAAGPVVMIHNCAYGSGTKANTSGTVSSTLVSDEFDALTLATDTEPWIDAANGDFRLKDPACFGTGYNTWAQTAASYAGIASYDDRGAAQHRDSMIIINNRRLVR